MKTLFVKSLLLVAPFALMLAFVEYELRQLPNSYSSTRAALEQQRGDIDVLITGTSHTEVGVRADLLAAHAFNLANRSQSLHYDTQLVLKYAPALPRLKLVIFTLSYHSLEYKLNNSIERWRAGFYQQVYGLPGEDARQRLQLTNYSYLALYTPKEAYWQVLEHFRGGGVAAAVPHGAAVLPQQGDVSEDSGRQRVRFHESEMHQSDIPANRAALEHACRELKRQHIAVVFITVPTDRTYYDYIQLATYQRMQNTIRQISAECPAEYFNYLLDPRFAHEDFFDSDHLNGDGAEKFSQIINQDIIAKYVQGR